MNRVLGVTRSRVRYRAPHQNRGTRVHVCCARFSRDKNKKQKAGSSISPFAAVTSKEPVSLSKSGAENGGVSDFVPRNAAPTPISAHHLKVPTLLHRSLSGPITSPIR